MDYYYGCVPVLAWALGHYFYNGKHYAWVAADYYPYGRGNPRSSNPHRVYESLYEPWKDADNYDKYISQTRISLRNGVEAKEKAGVVTASDAVRLKTVCDKIETAFFYPIVIRVDVDSILPATRKTVAGSGLAGSDEYLIKDLGEAEFTALFVDIDNDAEVKTLVVDEIAGTSTTSSADALLSLEGRLIP